MIKGFDGVTLWSSDLNKLLPFYRDLMGLPVALESPGFVILGEFENPRLCIGTHSEVHGRPTDPHRWLLRFESTDLRADLDRLRAAGVESRRRAERPGRRLLARHGEGSRGKPRATRLLGTRSARSPATGA